MWCKKFFVLISKPLAPFAVDVNRSDRQKIRSEPSTGALSCPGGWDAAAHLEEQAGVLISRALELSLPIPLPTFLKSCSSQGAVLSGRNTDL